MSRISPGGLQDLGRLRTVGVALISLTGLIHLVVTPEYYGFAAYLGPLMLADFAGPVARSRDGRRRFLGAHRGPDVGAARTPVLGAFTEPPALVSLVVEASSWGSPRTCSPGGGGLLVRPVKLRNIKLYYDIPGFIKVLRLTR